MGFARAQLPSCGFQKQHGTKFLTSCCRVTFTRRNYAMISRKFAVALLAPTLMTGAAYAQNTNNNANTNTAASSSSSNSGSMHQPGQWRASKLAGVNVYNENNEKIGDISDVILDKSGKAENVIIGVGGF